jgi:hypothetical protein
MRNLSLLFFVALVLFSIPSEANPDANEDFCETIACSPDEGVCEDYPAGYATGYYIVDPEDPDPDDFQTWYGLCVDQPQSEDYTWEVAETISLNPIGLPMACCCCCYRY